MRLGEIIQIIVSSAAFGGIAWWIHLLSKAIDAQKQTIETQSKTIEAQSQIMNSFKAMTETMGRVLESVDEPKTLARMKAYKELVDEEQKVAIRNVKRKLEQQNHMFATMEAQTAKVLGPIIGALTELGANSIPYIPPNRRASVINATSLPPEFKEGFQKLADEALDYSTFPGSLAAALTVGQAVEIDMAMEIKPFKPSSNS